MKLQGSVTKVLNFTQKAQKASVDPPKALVALTPITSTLYQYANFEVNIYVAYSRLQY